MTFRRLVSGLLALALCTVVTAAPAFAASEKAPAGKVNLNTATAEQLSTVPGVGPKLAARIVEHRQKTGGFKAVEDILGVKGIGEKSFAKMQGHLTLGDAPKPAAAR
jgi:competence protein ComEA